MVSQIQLARRTGFLLPCVILLACTSSYFRPKAAESLRCPEGQLQVEAKTAYSSLVTGCGKSDVIVLDGTGAFISVRERAAFELSCAADSIEVTVIDPNLYGASGCDKKITYKHFSGHGIVAQVSSEPR
jgi:hypothetical protein